jgi:SAM-dependent methyltransferase
MGSLQRKLDKARAMGPLGVLRTLARKLPRYVLLPAWWLFRMQHAGNRPAQPTDSLEQAEAQLAQKEVFLHEILGSAECHSFLEIGIGPQPNLERIKLMLAQGVHYTACDFQQVCDLHRAGLAGQGVDVSALRFAANQVGSYSWTLFEMLQAGESFDVIYLDGHHTFYVDFPAFALAHYLLKPGGIFVVDDIEWTLDFLAGNMARSFDEWYFYRKIYSFSDYRPEQRGLPHMKMIVEELLLGRLGYRRDEALCIPEWWTLRKPQTGPDARTSIAAEKTWD